MFVGESAGAAQIIEDLQLRGEKIARDAFGHIKLDAVNAGEWFAAHFGKRLGAEKTLVQKSGYFSRSPRPTPRRLPNCAANHSPALTASSLIWPKASRPIFSPRDCRSSRISGCAGAFADEEDDAVLFLDHTASALPPRPRGRVFISGR